VRVMDKTESDFNNTCSLVLGERGVQFGGMGMVLGQYSTAPSDSAIFFSICKLPPFTLHILISCGCGEVKLP
jgi:hypothetical protein